jgi:predicted nucleic acid-binding protein
MVGHHGWDVPGREDSIVLATARVAEATIVTGDKHFRGLPEVELL